MNMIKREIKKRYINTLHPRFFRYSYKKYEEQWSIDELIDNTLKTALYNTFPKLKQNWLLNIQPYLLKLKLQVQDLSTLK